MPNLDDALDQLESRYGLDDIADALREVLGCSAGDLDAPMYTALTKVQDDPGFAGLSEETRDCVHFLRNLLRVRK